MKQSIYEKVTNQIIADLEKGVRPWALPWDAEHAGGGSIPLRSNLQPYSGINVLMLWAEAQEQGYSNPIWVTYRQAQTLGGHVRKGEKSTPIVYASTYMKKEKNSSGKEEERLVPFLKQYFVFNVEQCADLPGHYYRTNDGPILPESERIDHAEKFIKAINPDIKHKGDQAFYVISQDFIQIPKFESFHDPQRYYSVLFHELVHWTRHESRLNRSLGRKMFGDEGYAREELVAEIGAAFLCAELGIDLEVREDHSSYISGWLQVLQNDHRAVFQASSHAQKAVEFIKALAKKESAEAA